jgi:hypothetical protein
VAVLQMGRHGMCSLQWAPHPGLQQHQQQQEEEEGQVARLRLQALAVGSKERWQQPLPWLNAAEPCSSSSSSRQQLLLLLQP